MDVTLERILSLLPRNEAGKIQHGARAEFAKSIGLKSGNVVADWVNGRSTSYEGYLYEIAAKYHVSVEWLRGETNDATPPGVEEDALEIMNILGRMPPELRSRAIDVLKALAQD